ncbi:hypothetical protein HZ994_09355 [Akkermansiaceae bacterium]|nr:hypothetical protein HZ994_09355 [Akkermansiaceae bacterium]
MKTFASLLIATTIMAGSASAVEPTLTKANVSAIGAIILGDKSTAEFHDGFTLAKPQYDEEEGVWRFPAAKQFFPATPGAPLYFFEIRDTDGHFRIGSISGTGYSPKSAERFRMPPALRKKIRAIAGK